MNPYRRVFRDKRKAIFGVARLHQSCPRVIGDPVTRKIGVGPSHSVTRDGAKNNPRIDFPQVLKSKAALCQRSRPHGLDYYVGISNQITKHVFGFFCLQVQRERALAAMDMPMQERGVFDDGPGHLPDVVTLRRLHLDDVCTKVCQMKANGAGTKERKLDNSQA